MTVGLVGTKAGMTQMYDEQGMVSAVTVIALGSANRVTQIKTKVSDGYSAIQITAGTEKNANRVRKPLAGHFAKAKVEAGRVLKEFRIDNEEMIDTNQHASAVTENDGKLRIGSEITVDIFKVGQLVDVTAVSKGKGFAGTVKRHNFATQDATHGNSRSHRVPGSIGQNQTPRKVFKGKKMCGHMGSVIRTVQNQKIVAIDHERNLLMIRGAVPGAPQSVVVVTPAIKVNKNEENK